MKLNGISPRLQEDLLLRQDKMQFFLRQMGADACILTGNTNLCYALGAMAEGYFYLPAQGRGIFFAKPGCSLSGEDVLRITRPEMIPKMLEDLGLPLPGSIALEDDEISAAEWIRLSRLFDVNVLRGASAARQARAVKTPYEIQLLRHNGRRHAELYENIPSLYKPGMTDNDLCAEIECMLRRSGHIGLFRTFGFRMEAYSGSLVGGLNAAAPSPYDFALGGAGMTPLFPVGACGEVLKEGQTLVADLPFNEAGYMTDHSRCYSIGPAPRRARELFDISHEILDRICAEARPGVPCSALYEAAQQVVSRHSVQDCFMGTRKQARFVGHGVGIEINELPVIAPRFQAPLQEGMILALEPKFVVEGMGAVGAENTYLVTSEGLENLTPCPEQIIELG
jgi:Xaa-Pro aminopeptidase